MTTRKIIARATHPCPGSSKKMLRNPLLAALLTALLVVPALASAQTTPPAAEGAKPAAGANATQIVATVCAACHGTDGRGTAPTNPNLAGLPADYITLQLAHFKSGLRQNPIMQGFAATLSDADMVALGEYFAKQKPVTGKAHDAALAKAGQAIFRGGIAASGVPACAACHSPDGAGIPKNFPRVAGQSADYTYAQLKAFHDGARGDDKDGKDVDGHIMHTIAARLTDAEMHAVAEYMQGLR
jgi:cytochrome c553